MSNNKKYDEFSEGMNLIHEAFFLLRGGLNNPTAFLYLLYSHFEGLLVDYAPGKKPLLVCLYPRNKWEEKLFNYYAPVFESLDQGINASMVENSISRLQSISDSWWSSYKHVAISVLIQRITGVNGKSMAEYVQPSDLTHVVQYLAGIKDGDSVYNPFAGSASFSVLCSDKNLYVGQEINTQAYLVGLMRILITEGNPEFFLLEDSIHYWGGSCNMSRLYDLVVGFPPYGLRLRSFDYPEYDNGGRYFSGEEFFLTMGSKSLRPGGKLIGIFAPSVLYGNRETYTLRRELVEANRINTVIQLPSNLLSSTSIGLSIIVINDELTPVKKIRLIDAKSFVEKNKRETLLDANALIDAIESNDERYVKFISLEDVVKNDYSLIPDRYFQEPKAAVVIPEGFQMKPLSDIATISRGTSKNMQICRVIRGKDLVSKGPLTPLSFKELVPETIRNNQAKIVDKDAILLLKVGQLKPTLFTFTGIDVSLNPNVIALQPKEGIDPVYLANELRKDYVSEQVKGMSYGMVIPALSLGDILNINVLVPDDLTMQKASLANEERLAKEQAVKTRQVQEYLERYKSSIFEMLSIRRHRIKPYLSGLSSNVAMLLEDIESSGVLKADQELFDGYTVKDALLNMRQNLAEVSTLFKTLTSEVDTGDEESIDLLKFVQNYKYSSKLPDRPVKVVVDSPSDVEDFGPIAFNSDNLREILDEIIFNAQKHFAPGTTDGTVALVPKAETDCISLLICNNGTPLPDDFDEEKSFTAGYFRDEQGSGMGLFRVRQVCDRFGATIEWANDPSSIMPVALRITFKRSLL